MKGVPWFRASKNGWYVWHNGAQVRLAAGKESKAEAFAAYAVLLGEKSPLTEAALPTVCGLVDDYLAAAAAWLSSRTHEVYAAVLRAFKAAFGGRQAAALRAADLEGWAKSQAWNSTTKRFALTVCVSVLRWAVKTERLAENPIVGLTKPPQKIRGTEALLTDGDHEAVMRAAGPALRAFLTARKLTGCRPGEAASVTAAEVVWSARCWILTAHKTAAKGKPRVIYLCDEMLARRRELAERHPTGPLFLNGNGGPWTKWAWSQAVRRAKGGADLGRRCVAYFW